MEMKVCSKCLIEKGIDEFYLEKRNKSGVMGSCKDCYNSKQKEWRVNNSETLKEREKKKRETNYGNIKKNNKKYYINNVDKVNERNREWRKNNPNRSKEFSKKWKIKNLDKIKQYTQIPEIKVSHNMRCRINEYLKIHNISKKNKTFDIVGCTPEFLKEHLERQFKVDMNWDNYGIHGWHIDHKIPLSSAKTEEEIYKLCHYTNLQPLWAEENLKKSNKLIKK
jgi:hypothetical protein